MMEGRSLLIYTKGNNMSLAERLMKKTKLSGASVMATSKFFETKAGITTDVPVINLALSGWLNGGFDNELVCLAGPSKHFKSALGLIMCEAFQRKHQLDRCDRRMIQRQL